MRSVIVTHTTTLSVGGDPPSWEGEATFKIRADYASKRVWAPLCVAIDGQAVDRSNWRSRHEAETLELLVEDADWFRDEVLEIPVQ